jgi:hypothetical protein
MNNALGVGLVIAIIAITLFTGCIDEVPIPPPTPVVTPTHSPTPSPIQSPVPDANQSEEEKLRIGAFNIQVFGTTKASKPEVMEVLDNIIRTYDVVAIQEIRDKSQTALPTLHAKLLNYEEA